MSVLYETWLMEVIVAFVTWPTRCGCFVCASRERRVYNDFALEYMCLVLC